MIGKCLLLVADEALHNVANELGVGLEIGEVHVY